MSIPETSSLTTSTYLSNFTDFAVSLSSKATAGISFIAQNALKAMNFLAGTSCKAFKGSCVTASSFSSKHPTAVKTGIAALAVLGIGYAVKANISKIKAFLPK